MSISIEGTIEKSPDQSDSQKLANSPDPRTDGIVLDYQVPVERGERFKKTIPALILSL